MEGLTILNKLFRGSVLRTIVLVSNILVSFFMMPFLVHSLGNRWYGFWALAGSILGYYGLLDLGLSSAVTRFVSQAFGQKRHDEINILVNSAVVMYSVIGLVVFLVALSTAALVPLFMESTKDVWVVRWVLAILGLSFSIGFPFRALSGILVSKYRFDLLSLILLIKLVARSTLMVVFIKMGYSLIAMAIITFSVEIIAYAINFLMVRSEFPELEFSLTLLRFERIKNLFSYAKYTFLSQIADQLRGRIAPALIAAFLSLSHVTFFQIASRLTDYYNQLLVSSFGMLTPVFSQLEGQKDFKAIHAWFLSSTKIAVTASTFIGMSILFYGKIFIQKWMGPEYDQSYVVLTILVSGYMIGLMQLPSVTLLYGISKHRYYAFANILEGLTSLILSLILIQKYGLTGVAAGTAIPLILFRLIPQPIYTCKAIGYSLSKYFLNCLIIPSIKVAVPVSIYFWLVISYLRPDYIRILLLFVIQLILFLPVAYMVCLQSVERGYLVAALRNT